MSFRHYIVSFPRVIELIRSAIGLTRKHFILLKKKERAEDHLDVFSYNHSTSKNSQCLFYNIRHKNNGVWYNGC